MAFRTKDLQSAIKTTGGTTYLLNNRTGYVGPSQQLDDFDETLIGRSFPLIIPTVIRGSAEVRGNIWEANNPILAEFTNDREVELAVWHVLEGSWHWGKYILPDAAPTNFSGVYAFSGTWRLQNEAIHGKNCTTATSVSSIDVPAGAYAFIYKSSAGDGTVTVTKGSNSWTATLSGGSGMIVTQLQDSSSNAIGTDQSAATVAATSGMNWGIGSPLTL